LRTRFALNDRAGLARGEVLADGRGDRIAIILRRCATAYSEAITRIKPKPDG